MFDNSNSLLLFKIYHENLTKVEVAQRIEDVKNDEADYAVELFMSDFTVANTDFQDTLEVLADDDVFIYSFCDYIITTLLTLDYANTSVIIDELFAYALSQGFACLSTDTNEQDVPKNECVKVEKKAETMQGVYTGEEPKSVKLQKAAYHELGRFYYNQNTHTFSLSLFPVAYAGHYLLQNSQCMQEQLLTLYFTFLTFFIKFKYGEVEETQFIMLFRCFSYMRETYLSKTHIESSDSYSELEVADYHEYLANAYAIAEEDEEDE